MRALITYFSASGVTKGVAENIKEVIGGDIFEIAPVTRYTSEDLDWTNPNSRSSLEMKNETSRPEIVGSISNISEYDTIIIGFPVWWNVAPHEVNTFIESYDLTNKNIYVFVTSGSSSVDGSINSLRNLYPNLNFIDAIRFNRNTTTEDINNFIK